MTFRIACSATTFIFLMLSLTLVWLPELVYWLFSVEQAPLGDFIAKRAGMLFLGLSVLCFLSRNSFNAELQQIVVATVMTAMGTMALLGIYEFSHGNVGPGIWLAILVEITLCGLFFNVWQQVR